MYFQLSLRFSLEIALKSIYLYLYFLPNQERDDDRNPFAKLFKNGASQAVRLPAEFRFDGDEVYVSRDDATGDVVLSNRPGAKTWNEFFELLHAIDVPADFMAERPMNVLPQGRGLFDDELIPHSKAGRL